VDAGLGQVDGRPHPANAAADNKNALGLLTIAAGG
jgi:hypothetical protein